MQEPREVEHEQTVIAGLMNDDACYFDGLAELEDEHFSDPIIRNVFNKLVANGNKMNANILVKESKDPKEKAAIRTFDGSWKSKEEFYFSLQKVKDTFLKRRLYESINKMVTRFDNGKFDDLLAGFENDMNTFRFNDNGENIIDPKERAPEALAEFWDRVDNPDKAKGIPFSITNSRGITKGFPSLDDALNGAYGGDLMMIAAKTGEGKTGFALNLARHFSFHQEYRGYYMNTEMRIDEMEARLLAPLAGVKANEILYGRLEGTTSEIDMKKDRISDAYNKYMKSNLIMSRIPDLPLHKAKGLAKQVRSKFESLDYIIVDYVGRMEIKGYENANTWDELYKITQELKELAMTLNVPIFLLAQRNQAGEVEGAKKMMNECDGVLFFEPTNESDQEYIERDIRSDKTRFINYKIIKKKVRRDDKPAPIYVMYDKTNNFINEVR